MSYKGYCQNCGSKLQITYASNGIMVMFCPHVPAQVVKTGIGMLKHLEIYCHNSDKAKNTKECMRSTAIYENPKAAKLHADTEAKRQAFDSLTRDSDVTFEDLRVAVDHTVSEGKLLEYANIAIMLELPIDELPTLFRSAMKLGYATGISTKAAIRALCIGIGRQSRLVLDNIGVVFKANDAYAWFKQEHPNETFDRVTAWKRYAINQVKEKAEMLKIGKQSEKARLERLYAHLRNSRTEFGRRVLRQ